MKSSDESVKPETEVNTVSAMEKNEKGDKGASTANIATPLPATAPGNKTDAPVNNKTASTNSDTPRHIYLGPATPDGRLLYGAILKGNLPDIKTGLSTLLEKYPNVLNCIIPIEHAGVLLTSKGSSIGAYATQLKNQFLGKGE